MCRFIGKLVALVPSDRHEYQPRLWHHDTLSCLQQVVNFKAGSSAGTAEKMETETYFYSPDLRISQGQSNLYCNLQQSVCPRSYSSS